MHLAARIERSGMNLALGTFILMFSLAAGSHHLHVRPHIATMFFMAIVYTLLCDVEAEQKNKIALVADTYFYSLVEYSRWRTGWAFHTAACGPRLDVGRLAGNEITFVGKKIPDFFMGYHFTLFFHAVC